MPDQLFKCQYAHQVGLYHYPSQMLLRLLRNDTRVSETTTRVLQATRVDRATRIVLVTRAIDG